MDTFSDKFLIILQTEFFEPIKMKQFLLIVFIFYFLKTNQQILSKCTSYSCGIDIGVKFTTNNTICRKNWLYLNIACSNQDIGAHFTDCNNDKKDLFFFFSKFPFF